MAERLRSRFSNEVIDSWTEGTRVYQVVTLVNKGSIDQGKLDKQYTIRLQPGTSVKVDAPNPPFTTDETSDGRRKPRKASAKKASVKKASVKKASVKKASVKKASVKKASVKKASSKKASAKKASAKKASAKKASAKKAVRGNVKDKGGR